MKFLDTKIAVKAKWAEISSYQLLLQKCIKTQLETNGQPIPFDNEANYLKMNFVVKLPRHDIQLDWTINEAYHWDFNTSKRNLKLLMAVIKILSVSSISRLDLTLNKSNNYPFLFIKFKKIFDNTLRKRN